MSVKFKVGDIVKIVRKAEGVHGIWVPSLVQYMDEPRKITQLVPDSKGIVFAVRLEGARNWNFPLESLDAFSEFKIGDKVRLIKIVEKEDGWVNSWSSNMDKYIGTEGIIREITKAGIVFSGDNRMYGWPSGAFVLADFKFIDGIGVSFAEFTKRTATPPVELTIEEIESKLGYKIKLK